MTFRAKAYLKRRYFDSFEEYRALYPDHMLYPFMLDGAIENIVFLELKRRGYDVYIGKNGTKEIDFVADKRGERIYVQVCVRLPEKSDRETGNLMEIADNYPKYVVTLNDLDTGIENGIKVVHLYDFLTAESW